MYNETNRQALKSIAQSSIQHGLTHPSPLRIEPDDYSPELTEIKASFVTLKIKNNLRGCIGTLEAHRPLLVDVAHNAAAAAFKDPRFPAVTATEYNQLQYHISILSVPQKMNVDSEEDLYTQLQPGKDGIVLIDGHYRSTFLPSVWESLTTPKSFIHQLKLKAGLDALYWSDSIHFERYEVEEF